MVQTRGQVPEKRWPVHVVASQTVLASANAQRPSYDALPNFAHYAALYEIGLACCRLL